MRKITYQEIRSLAAGGDTPTDSPLVSFVVPVFNTPADLLKRCMTSLIAQTYPNIEILIVDDGSDEDCANSIAEIAARDSRIRVIDVDHAGVSNARNVGIASAGGEWIAFADADDECVACFVEEAVTIALTAGCDFVCGSAVPLFEGDTKELGEGDFDCYVTDTDEDEIRCLAWQMLGHHKIKRLSGPNFMGRGPVAKLFKASLLQGLKYDEELPVGEDTLFNYRFIERCSNMAIVVHPWYWYHQYHGSAVHSADAELWARSIDRILASRRIEEEAAPFDLRCAYMSLQGVTSFVLAENRRIGHKDAVLLLRHTHGRGCYESDYSKDFSLSFWVKTMFRLCSLGLYMPAYLFWKVKTKTAFVLAGRMLIASLAEDDALRTDEH